MGLPDATDDVNNTCLDDIDCKDGRCQNNSCVTEIDTRSGGTSFINV